MLSIYIYIYMYICVCVYVCVHRTWTDLYLRSVFNTSSGRDRWPMNRIRAQKMCSRQMAPKTQNSYSLENSSNDFVESPVIYGGCLPK
jgi:hypothetical protein